VFYLAQIILILLLFLSCTKNSSIVIPKAEKGYLDLRQWNFHGANTNNGNINLDGEWEFFWEEWVDLNKFSENTNESFNNKTWIPVPSSWNDHNVGTTQEPKIIDGDGHATYRLRFSVDPNLSLSIQLPTMGTAYNFYINKKLVYKVGEIGKTLESSKPDYKSDTLRLPYSETGEYEFIFHISNFSYKQGGIWYPISLGLDREITKVREKNLFIDLFLSGSILIMGLYHLGLYSVKRKDKSALWFGLVCIFVPLRTLLTGEFYLYTLFPHFPFDLGIKLEYLTFYYGIPLFILFVQEIFPEDSPKKAVKFVLVASLIFSIPVILFPPRIFTHTVASMKILALFASFLGIYIFIKSIYNQREGAKSFLAGSILLTLTLINDILHTSLIIYTGFYSPFGLFIFIFSQAFLLSVRFAKAFTQVEELSGNLEQKVIERTIQLEQAKKIAEKEREKSDELLLNILPEEVAQELKEKGMVSPVLFESVSIMFTDFKGFTKIAEGLTPEELIKELDYCFSQFDKITEKHGLEKLKTIGDSYMCAGGIPKSNKTHALDACLAAIEIQEFMNKIKQEKMAKGIPFWELRLGIHTGPVMAGVVGQKKFAYDIWGDTVNTASRMESSGVENRINISATTYEMIKDRLPCEYRGEVDAKNKGKIKMYYLI
jgi:class 3 adenylate cyclase